MSAISVTDSVVTVLMLAGIGLVVLGPMLWLIFRQTKRLFRAMIALRDRIDRSQRH